LKEFLVGEMWVLGYFFWVGLGGDIDFAKLEDVYIQLVENEWVEEEEFCNELKFEFLLELYVFFDGLGHLSRWDTIMKKLAELQQKYPNDGNLGYVYAQAIYHESVDIFTLDGLDLDISKKERIYADYEFSDNQNEFIDYLKNRFIADYYSSYNMEKGIPYLNNIVDYAIKTKDFHTINCVLDQMMGYGMKYLDLHESKLKVLNNLVDKLWEGRTDKESHKSYLHIDLLKLGFATK
jgi:hypothetical protein